MLIHAGIRLAKSLKPSWFAREIEQVVKVHLITEIDGVGDHTAVFGGNEELLATVGVVSAMEDAYWSMAKGSAVDSFESVDSNFVETVDKRDFSHSFNIA